MIGFVLFSRPLKLILGLPGVLMFNSINKVMFNIGIFPLAMIASYVLFLPPEGPAVLWRALQLACHGDAMDDARIAPRVNTRWHPFWFVAALPDTAADAKRLCARDEESGATAVRRRRGTWPCFSGGATRELLEYCPVAFIASFVLFHATFPLRHLVLYPSGVSWHEEGHFGAWHMMLRSKRGEVMFDFFEDGSESEHTSPRHRVFLSSDKYLSERQRHKLVTKPHAALLYVQHMARVYREAGRNLTAVHARSCFMLNNRAPAKLFVESANLLDWLYRYEYVWPLGERTGVLEQKPKIPWRWLPRMQSHRGFLTSLPPVSTLDDSTSCRSDVDWYGMSSAERRRITMSPVHNELHHLARIRRDGDGVYHASGSFAYTMRWHLPP